MSKRKIYLISPPAGETRKSYPYSLLYLHSYLLKHGYLSEILDCDNLKWSIADLVDYLVANRADLIGLTGYTHHRLSAYKTIRDIKTALPCSTIVVGGRHFSALSVETLENIKEVDYVVKGEGEITLKELCDTHYSGTSLSDVAGITYRDNGTVIDNPDRPVATNIDDLAYDLSLFKDIWGSHDLVSTMRRFPTSKGFTVMAGRGCPGCCVFCTLSSQRIRLRNVDKVLDEIEHLIAKTGIRNISFADPTLTASSAYLTSLCEALLKRNLHIKWHCYSRVDVPSEIFDLMKKSGCVSVDVALETASPKVLKAVKKHISVADVDRVIRKLHKVGIKSFVFNMISLPDEREEDAELTLRFLEDRADLINGASLSITQILPDAALYRISKERKLLPKNFNWFDEYYDTTYYDRSNARSTVPFYREHLSWDFILHMRERFEKLHLEKFYDKYRLRNEFLKNAVPFFCDWKNQTFRSKARKVKKGLIRLPYVFKTR